MFCFFLGRRRYPNFVAITTSSSFQSDAVGFEPVSAIGPFGLLSLPHATDWATPTLAKSVLGNNTSC